MSAAALLVGALALGAQSHSFAKGGFTLPYFESKRKKKKKEADAEPPRREEIALTFEK